MQLEHDVKASVLIFILFFFCLIDDSVGIQMTKAKCIYYASYGMTNNCAYLDDFFDSKGCESIQIKFKLYMIIRIDETWGFLVSSLSSI